MSFSVVPSCVAHETTSRPNLAFEIHLYARWKKADLHAWTTCLPSLFPGSDYACVTVFATCPRLMIGLSCLPCADLALTNVVATLTSGACLLHACYCYCLTAAARARLCVLSMHSKWCQGHHHRLAPIGHCCSQAQDHQSVEIDPHVPVDDAPHRPQLIRVQGSWKDCDISSSLDALTLNARALVRHAHLANPAPQQMPSFPRALDLAAPSGLDLATLCHACCPSDNLLVYLGHHACHGHLATHAQQSGEPSLCQVFYRTVRSLRPLRAFVPPLSWTFSSTCAAFCEVLPHHHLPRVGYHASLDLIATICVCFCWSAARRQPGRLTLHPVYCRRAMAGACMWPRLVAACMWPQLVSALLAPP